MSNHIAPPPHDPIAHRARLASIYASLPPHLQKDALALIERLPRMIHNLARAGELSAPDFSALRVASDTDRLQAA